MSTILQTVKKFLFFILFCAVNSFIAVSNNDVFADVKNVTAKAKEKEKNKKKNKKKIDLKIGMKFEGSLNKMRNTTLGTPKIEFKVKDKHNYGLWDISKNSLFIKHHNEDFEIVAGQGNSEILIKQVLKKVDGELINAIPALSILPKYQGDFLTFVFKDNEKIKNGSKMILILNKASRESGDQKYIGNFIVEMTMPLNAIMSIRAMPRIMVSSENFIPRSGMDLILHSVPLSDGMPSGFFLSTILSGSDYANIKVLGGLQWTLAKDVLLTIEANTSKIIAIQFDATLNEHFKLKVGASTEISKQNVDYLNTMKTSATLFGGVEISA
jgi:hypothetical protein